MKYHRIPSFLLFSIGLLIAHFSFAGGETPFTHFYDRSPTKYAGDIHRFAQEVNQPGGIVAVGSSSMRMWGSIQRDLAPLTIIRRGFGGSTFDDVLYSVDTLILKSKPRAVLIYEGDNDIAHGASPEVVADCFQAIVEKVHAKQPDVRFYVMSIKPSIARKNLWGKMQDANERLQAICEANPLLTYIDSSTVLLNSDGSIRSDILKDDMLHMKPEGYALWTEAVAPVLKKAELSYE